MVSPVWALGSQRYPLLILSQAIGNMLCDFRQLSASLRPQFLHLHTGRSGADAL